MTPKEEMTERILRRWMEHPEILDELARRLEEDPVEWHEMDLPDEETKKPPEST